MKTSYSQHELDDLVASASPRTGWDFSRMRALRAPVAWDYGEVVTRFLKPSDEVLDVGTGDGRQFARLAAKFRRGLGIDTDPEMIRLAEQEHSGPRLEFRVGSARLEGVTKSFPVVINRHAVIDLGAVAAHLEPGGYFVTQQVGERNMACVRQALGQSASYPAISSHALAGAGLRVVAFCEYDVEYVVRDIESLVFWLNALDLAHADLAGSAGIASAATFNEILAGNVDRRGFVTNEHRYLAIGQAPG
ncbi:MAG TPA: class I SAM-dependent methyltransferase [Streptosporangiaceae bacterium]|nr:class I SAM-dependent methyltransferase [Streptosporangiaceae bacterium]